MSIEKPIEKITMEELKTKIVEIKAMIRELQLQLIQLLEPKIAEIQAEIE